MKTDFRCGTVAFLGAPNAGKSSLVNALVGCAVTITAPSAGTTREAIRGILNTNQAQIIFVDTPGMQRATNLLERQMNRAISTSVKTADVIGYVIDVNQVTQSVLQKLGNYQDFGVPIIVILTKIDTVRPEKVIQALDKLKDYSFVKEFIPVSALKRKGLEILVQCLENLLPVGAPRFDAIMYTDSSEREMAAEIIREAVINQLRDEIPAGIKVKISKYLTEGRTTTIDADIICDKPNHKKIIIGTQGKVIRTIGIMARQKIEKMLGQHVVLQTFVMVREGWRNQTQWLKD